MGRLTLNILLILYYLGSMKDKAESYTLKQHWISTTEKKSRELVYKLIDINKDITSEGKTFRLGGRVYFVRELG
jgi:hypothetical protein